MKIIAWIIAPFFMLLKEFIKDDTEGLSFIFIIPIVFLQIFYWYVIFNFPVVFGLQ